MRMVFPSPNSTRLMDELASDVGTLVETFFGDAADRSSPSGGRRMAVPLDIEESDDAYLVTLDVPGVAIESIAIDIHEDTLTIAGHRTTGNCATGHCSEVAAEGSDESLAQDDENAAPSLKRLRRERASGRFERKLELPLPVESDAVTAELSEGVLVVRLPKADPEKGKRRIPISHG